MEEETSRIDYVLTDEDIASNEILQAAGLMAGVVISVDRSDLIEGETILSAYIHILKQNIAAEAENIDDADEQEQEEDIDEDTTPGSEPENKDVRPAQNDRVGRSV